MMRRIIDMFLAYLQKFCINVLTCGPIPNHIAIIMDGNRRYAARENVQKIEGHIRGVGNIVDTMKGCLKLGITELTVYAFSIENFNRTKEEVVDLLKLAKEKLQKLVDEKEKLMEAGVCIRLICNHSLLPEDLKKTIAEVLLMTKENNKAFLNVAFAYTSRDEIATTIKDIVSGVKENHIEVEDIDEEFFESCLFTNCSKNPDILIRTSGEVRLSDYLMWQISKNSIIMFFETLWPDFSIWHIFAMVFKYQRGCGFLQSDVEHIKHCNERVKIFLKRLKQKRFSKLCLNYV